MKIYLHSWFVGAVFGILAVSQYSIGAEITIHVAGQVHKPGPHKIESPIAPEELSKACGGWTEFGSAKRLQVIRLARPSCPTLDDEGEKTSRVFELAEIPKKDGKFLLKPNDIIYIPMKIIYGR